ncbi:MAG: ABC transporter permease [bacterium]
MFTKNGNKYLKNLLLSLLSFTIVIVLWTILSYGFSLPEITLPSPISVVNDIISLFLLKNLANDVFISLIRISIGFGTALIIGIPLGILCGTNKNFSIFVETNINFLRFIPAASMIPLLILWFGVGEIGKIFLIFIRALPYLILYISNAASSVDKEYMEMARVLGAKNSQLLTAVVFPKIVPQIWNIGRIEFGSSWSTVILAEVLGANSGLGYRIVLAERYIHISELFGLIIISGGIALLIDYLLRYLDKILFPWSDKLKFIKL